jgi:hypothetical protein
LRHISAVDPGFVVDRVLPSRTHDQPQDPDQPR